MSNKNENPRSAAIYVRISQDRGGAKLGVERQEQECRALAQRLGWTVVDVYCDNDMSAFTGKRREHYERMLADIEAGKINAVIAWHPDRLHRRSMELERYINICEQHHVANETVTAGMWDLSTASGQMVARQLGAVSAYESKHKSERLRSARIQHAQQGKHHGGIRCYGYEKDGITVVADEAAEIKSACEQVAAGVSLRAIVRDMNTRGVRTAKGHTWTSTQLRQTLMSPRIAGHSTHKGVIVGDANWKGIVDDATWRAVEAILSNQKRRTNQGVTGAVKWLGSGLYICTCGQRSLRVSKTARDRRTYRCTNAHDKTVKHVTRDALALDDYVEKMIVKRLSRKGTITKLLRRDDTADVRALRVEQASLSDRKDKAAALFARGAIDEVQLATITAEINERDKEIATILAKAGRRSALNEDDRKGDGDPQAMQTLWAKKTLAQKRAIINEICDVHILPTKPTTRGFDPDGVHPDWKVN